MKMFVIPSDKRFIKMRWLLRKLIIFFVLGAVGFFTRPFFLGVFASKCLGNLLALSRINLSIPPIEINLQAR